MDRRLVDHLVSRELVSRSQMQRVILRATKHKRGLVEQILEDPSIDEERLAGELASFHGVELVERSSFHVNRTALKFLSKEMAQEHGVLPYGLSADADEVSVAVVDPSGAQEVLVSLQSATGTTPSVCVAPQSWLRGAIRHYYFGEEWEEAGAESNGKAAPAQIFRNDGSAEILLDDVVEDEPSKKRSGARGKNREKKRRPSPVGASAEVRGVSSSKSGSANPMAVALDDFDSFLDNGNSGLGKSSPGSAVTPPALDDLEEAPMHEVSLGSGWSSFDEADDDDFDNGFAAAPLGGAGEAPAGFDLFDFKSEAVDGEVTLQQIVERQEKTIQQMHRDLKQQREIIQALVDMLSESRVLSKRELKKRIRER